VNHKINHIPSLFAVTYGSGQDGSNLYSANSTTSTDGNSGSSSSSSNGSGGLANTGNAALLFTAVAVILIVAASVAYFRRRKLDSAKNNFPQIRL
jgi:LPXTG-motif cell wall-anchored protein